MAVSGCSSEKTSPFRMQLSAGAPWYITYVDSRGIERFLPTRRKMFGRWTSENCPEAKFGASPRHVYSEMDDGERFPDQVLAAFMREYPTPQAYLLSLNRR